MPAPATNRKSWVQVPESIKYVFDKFPLYTNPPAPVPQSVTSDCNTAAFDPAVRAARKLNLHVYNVDATDGLATDPSSIEIQGLLRLKNLADQARTTVVSSHSAPTNVQRLPYLVDKRGSKSVIYKSPQSIRTNLLLPPVGATPVYTNLVATSLQDWWTITVIMDSHLREVVFGEGQYRSPIVPGVVENFLKDEWTQEIIEELRPRYPAVIDALVTNNSVIKATSKIYGLVRSQIFVASTDNNADANNSSNIVMFFKTTKQGQNILAEIRARAREALEVFSTLIKNSDTGFLGVGLGNSETLKHEDVTHTGLGSLDILVFSYVYRMSKGVSAIVNSEFTTLLAEFPEVLDHSERVYSNLFSQSE
ncbi:hypothetical protein D0Z00_002374 [Geotrichum galactomycetum]|uniref:Uncharacterized protein n=1 Tax=Geotrichum galactomycetum TaxID=27317 RepID=A0ACB6V4B3_9ASCO|nr:hypothetical protein D0Z00_002374 [Geotrichum candidum]